jgi:hypothetical protein
MGGELSEWVATLVDGWPTKGMGGNSEDEWLTKDVGS